MSGSTCSLKLCCIYFLGWLCGVGSGLRIQVTGLWKWAAGNEPGNAETVQTEQVVQPLLYSVSRSVADGLVKRNLMKWASCVGKITQRSMWWRRRSGHTRRLKHWHAVFTCCQPRCVGGPVLCRHGLLTVCALLPQLLNQFEGEGAPGALIPAERKYINH